MSHANNPPPLIFDVDALSRMAVSDGMMGNVEEIRLDGRTQLSFCPASSGTTELWEQRHRHQARHYVIGAALRPSEGSAPGWAVACVLDERTGNQVAQIREQLP